MNYTNNKNLPIAIVSLLVQLAVQIAKLPG